MPGWPYLLPFLVVLGLVAVRGSRWSPVLAILMWVLLLAARPTVRGLIPGYEAPSLMMIPALLGDAMLLVIPLLVGRWLTRNVRVVRRGDARLCDEARPPRSF